jgi:hypothetical protein
MQDATVHSIPSTSPAPAVAPSSYVAAPQAAAPAPAAPAPAQVGTYYPQAVPQAAPQAPTSYQSAPSPYVQPSQAQPQASPWESAFNRVVGLLGTPVASPFQGQSSPQTSATPQYTQANWQSQDPSQYMARSAQQTSQPSPTSYSNSSQTYSVSSLGDVADVLGWSPESRQVVEAYGTEAPAILNQYALNLEGMLDSAVDWAHHAEYLFGGAAQFMIGERQENLAYNEILTNPDVLSDYTLKFFGPEGPYPVYEHESQLETRGYPTGTPVAGINMPAPPAAAAPQQPTDFWGAFTDQMSRDPQNAWRIVNQADPRVMANKLFVME